MPKTVQKIVEKHRGSIAVKSFTNR